MPELLFPAYDIFLSRGSCGKKNCTAVVTGPMAAGLGLEPTVLHFGGSGKPLIEDVKTAAEGDVVPWMYNTMISKIDEIGLLVARLDPNRTSEAVLGAARIGGREVLTVTEAVLYFRLYLPGSEAPTDAIEPLRLSLAAGDSETRTFAFRELAPAVLAEAGGVPMLQLSSSALTVTPPQHVEITGATRTASGVAFDVTLDEALGRIDGDVVAYAHNPLRPGDPIPVRELDPAAGSRQRVTFDLGAYRGVAEAERIYLEVVGLKDDRHIWSMAKV